MKLAGADVEDVSDNCAKEINAVVMDNKTFVGLGRGEITFDSAAEESV